MFSKRRFLAALSAALLISAALVVGSCISPLEEMFVKQEQGGDNIKASAGKGLIRISVSDSARTILPSTSLPALTSMYYTVSFRATNPANDVEYPEIADTFTDPRATKSQLESVTIPLEADDYVVTITGWSTDGLDTTIIGDGAGVEQAGWTSKTITVTAGSSSGITAALYGWVGNTSSDTGSFHYNITVPALPTIGSHPSWTITTLPSVYTTGSMTIKKGGSAVGVPIDLTTPGNITSTISTLTTGFYTVEIELTATNCQSRKGTYVMHIYKGQTSEFTYPIPPLNQNLFTVRFDKQLTGLETDTNNITASDQAGISNAGTVTPLSGEPAHSLGYPFGGWFDNSSGTGTAWSFGSSGTRVFKDTILYAKWNKGFTFELSILGDITYTINTGDLNYPGAGPYDYYMFANGGKVLSYTIDDATDYEDFLWELEGVQVSTTETLTIDSSNTAFLLNFPTGPQRIIVTATHKYGGVGLNTYIDITASN